MKTRRKFSAEFKTKVVLEALKERFTLSQIADKYEVHPNQINQWKKQFIENADTVFQSSSKTKKQEPEKDKQRLYSKIGQLQVENDFLKKTLK